jgi:hypothetical protein
MAVLSVCSGRPQLRYILHVYVLVLAVARSSAPAARSAASKPPLGTT